MAEKKNEATTSPSGGTATGTTGKVTKAEAIRQALGHLGLKAANAEIRKYIKEQLKIDMDLKQISTYKSEELKRIAKRAKKHPKPAAKASPSAATHPAKTAPIAHANNGKELARSLDAVRTVKTLLAQYGAASIRDLITILER
jgi:hypothetical protein